MTEAKSSVGARSSEDGGGLHLATARGKWVLTATVLGSAMAQLDATVVGIAQPAIGKEFHAQIAGLQWVSAGYLLTVAGLILLAGALCDRFGRRKIFVIGVAWFAVASLICAIAPNIGLLIAARMLQGVGGALLTPGSLAILEASFAPLERGRVIGAWSGLGGVATALGPFVGGFLITAVSWRLIFLINLPIAVAVIFISIRHVPETKDPDATGYIDIAGSALTVLALVGISYGLIQGSSGNWSSPVVLGALVIGVVALVVFVVVELHVRAPIVPLDIFKSRQFSATNGVTLLIYGMLGGMFFLLPIELQQVSHYSPTAAGASLLPITFMLFALSSRSGALSARIGPRLQMSVGPITVAAGTGAFRTDQRRGQLSHRGPAGRAGVRLRARDHRGTTHSDSDVISAGRTQRPCVGREQHRGAHRQPACRRAPPGGGRHHRRQLSAPAGVRDRLSACGVHCRCDLRCRRRAGVCHHPKSSQSGGTRDGPQTSPPSPCGCATGEGAHVVRVDGCQGINTRSRVVDSHCS